MRHFFLLCLSFLSISMYSQNIDLPYHEIPQYPETYTAGSVVSRLIDGLGFRYYWATEGLVKDDLMYKPSDKARSTEETIQHIHGLSIFILNIATKTPIDTNVKEPKLPYAEARKKTLENFKKASEILMKSNNLEEYKIIFKNNENTSEFPFWNSINGPIADAIWHAGQIVLMRRASGNPFNSKVSVFTGTVRK